MIVQQKELVLLPFPFSDLERKKVRPAVVISNNHFNQKSDDCIMIPLTSVIKDEPYSVVINQDDLSSGKLLKQSRARVDKIFAVEQAIVFMKIGFINNGTFGKIRMEIEKMF